MTIAGLGTDIVDIERIEAVLNRSGEAFAERILTDSELSSYQGRSPKQRANFLAKRFSAKEAASKALGTGIAQGVTFHDFIICHDENGKPCLNLYNKAKDLADAMGVTHIFLSISDEKRYAVSTVILER